ncbi:hypothetical protein RBH29_01840 [Herbivorax sp. ANBcel31]|uniref:hypothetical protein n=1 Tax=Herbivorax sp. ANBcel31 TaxID=3069754 RepID=UPI0027B5BE48|nr:hypothetical protein [Herbivorax sp. ANBcel31]MDQ2085176.1 hypothetical protein [Herbivorax sp. ANBcel31]
MNRNRKFYKKSDFEKILREYLKQAKFKLEHEYTGTREAMKLVAKDKTREFMQCMDRGLNQEERDYLSTLIMAAMYQSFCYGYGVGKVEGKDESRAFV